MAKQLTEKDIAQLQSLNRPSLTDAVEEFIKLVNQTGLSTDEVISEAGFSINDKGNRIEIDDSPKQEDIDEYTRLNAKQQVIPGQSLTNNPDQPYPWEKPPTFTNPNEALQNVIGRMLEPQAMGQIMQSLYFGASVSNIVEVTLFNDFMQGMYTPDMAILLYEPLFYTVMDIGESANLNYRVDDDIKINDLDNSMDETEKEVLDGLNSIKQQTLNKIKSGSNVVPEEIKENISQQTNQVRSLLAGGRND
tara:strand:- start:482 stop:1228 length:747 start_codon:yes stop_codon:yes gene_type:complete